MNQRRGEPETNERRRHFRADVDLAAVIHARTIEFRGRVVNLSLGGVRVRREPDSAPCPVPGTQARVDLDLGRHGWVSSTGHIQRCGLDDLVVQFDALPAELMDLIEDEVMAALDAARRPRMIVVDPSAARRKRVAEALRTAGCESYEAATPLEAIDMLERPRHRIRGVAMAEYLTQTNSNEFCDFVAETNPGIKLALIADGTVETPRVERVDAVLPGDETLETSLRGFVDSVSRRNGR